MIQTILPYLGVSSIALILATGILIVRNDPTTHHSSISSYAGAAKSQAWLAFFALIIFSIPFYFWIIFWLIPAYNLPSIMYPFIGASIISHILLIKYPLFPSKGKRYIGNLIHLGAGSVIALCMFGLITALSFTPAAIESFFTMIVLYITAGYMLFSLLAYVVTREQKYFFIFEVIYIVLFALSVAAITFVI